MSQLIRFGVTLEFDWPTEPDIRDTRAMDYFGIHIQKLTKMASGELPYLGPEYVHMNSLYEKGSAEWGLLRDRLVTRQIKAWTLDADTCERHPQAIDKEFWRNPAAVHVLEHGVCIRRIIGSMSVGASPVWVVLEAKDVGPTAGTPSPSVETPTPSNPQHVKIIECAQEIIARGKPPFVTNGKINKTAVSREIVRALKLSVEAETVTKTLNKYKTAWSTAAITNPGKTTG